MARTEARGGIESKITLRQQPHRYGNPCDSPERYRPSPVYLIPLLPPPLLSPLLRPVDKMLAGPYPPTHVSSCLFRDAMERRGRSRAVPTTAAIRKSRPHQRQLYYSHYPQNPPSLSPSPVRSQRYVSSDSVRFRAYFLPPHQLRPLDFPTIHYVRSGHATRPLARLLRISSDPASVVRGPDTRSVRARQHSPRQGSLPQTPRRPCSRRLRPPDRTGPRRGLPLRNTHSG